MFIVQNKLCTVNKTKSDTSFLTSILLRCLFTAAFYEISITFSVVVFRPYPCARLRPYTRFYGELISPLMYVFTTHIRSPVKSNSNQTVWNRYSRILGFRNDRSATAHAQSRVRRWTKETIAPGGQMSDSIRGGILVMALFSYYWWSYNWLPFFSTSMFRLMILNYEIIKIFWIILRNIYF